MRSQRARLMPATSLAGNFLIVNSSQLATAWMSIRERFPQVSQAGIAWLDGWCLRLRTTWKVCKSPTRPCAILSILQLPNPCFLAFCQHTYIVCLWRTSRSCLPPVQRALISEQDPNLLIHASERVNTLDANNLNLGQFGRIVSANVKASAVRMLNDADCN